jgi:ATPase family AAA domain-containing protein 1
MQLWDAVAQSEGRVLIVGATNRPQDLDSAIQRRFERSYLVGPPDMASRVQIFKAVFKDAPTDGFDFDTAAAMTQGELC